MRNVLLSLLLAFIAASCRTAEPVGNESTEKFIADNYTPEDEYSLPPQKGELVEDVDIEGSWIKSSGLDYTSIIFEKKWGGKYTVQFRSGGCLDDWALDREATYEEGVITFNKPVREYASSLFAFYTKMYTVKFRGTIYLVASERVEGFDEDDNPNTFDLWLLTRESDK